MGNVCGRDINEKQMQDESKDNQNTMRAAQPVDIHIPDVKTTTPDMSPTNNITFSHPPGITNTFVPTKDLNPMHSTVKKVYDSVKPRDFKQYPELKEHYGTPIEKLRNTVNNDTYHGHVVRGTPHGWGSMYSKQGELLEGVFDNGKPVSHLRTITVEGNDYEGELKQGARHGKGILYKLDGTSVNCENWVGGKPTGVVEERDSQGKLIFKGVRNEKGLVHGNCTYGCNDYTVEGNFQNGLISGNAKKRYYNGKYYEGTLNKDYIEEGSGSMTFVDGRKFKGPFAKGVPNGLGDFTSETGKTFQQTWKDGKRV